MSTRATIRLTDGSHEIWLYHHCDGYPEHVGEILKEAADNGQDMFDTATNLIKMRNAKGDDEEFILTSGQHMDISYTYDMEFDKNGTTVTCYEPDFSRVEDLQKLKNIKLWEAYDEVVGDRQN